MVQPTSKEFRFWFTLVRLSNLLRDKSSNDDDVRKFGDLTLRHVKCMETVWRLQLDYPEGIMLKQIAAELKLTPGTVSELVDSLVRKDMLTRVVNPEDRRGVRIALTKFSRDLIEACIQKTNTIAAELLTAVPEKEQNCLIGGLEAMLDKINNIN